MMKYLASLVLLVALCGSAQAQTTQSCTDTDSDADILAQLIPNNPTSRTTVTFVAGETCLVTTPLTIDTEYVTIQGNGATLDCSQLTFGTCITFAGSANANPGYYTQNSISENDLIVKGPGASVAGLTGMLAESIGTEYHGINVHDFATCYSLDGPNSFKELFVDDEGWNCGNGIYTGADDPSNSGESIKWIGGGIFNSTLGVVMQNSGSGFELVFDGATFDGLSGSAFTMATAPNSTAEVVFANSHIEYTSTYPSVDMIVLGGDNNYTWFRSYNSDFQVDGTNASGAIHSIINVQGSGWADVVATWEPISSYATGGGPVVGSGSANVKMLDPMKITRPH